MKGRLGAAGVAQLGSRCLWPGAAVLLLMAACAGNRPDATTPVIVAGSVCSGLVALSAPGPASQPSAASANALAYVRTTPRPELVVYDLTRGRERFRVPAALASRPELLADLVVTTDPHGQLIAFDASSGARRFSVKLARPHWLGAVRVGPNLVFSTTSLSFRPGERGSTVSAVDARSGALRWERSVPYALSRPSARGNRVYVASDHADVWELDANSGDAVGCARQNSGPIDWIQLGSRSILVGAAEQARELTTPAHALGLPITQLPGRPALLASQYDAAPAQRSALGRVALLAELAATTAGPELVAARYFFVFYRELFAFGADGQLLWARLLDSDVVRAQTLAGSGLLVLSEDGSLLQLNAASGALRTLARLAGPIDSADLAASALAPLPAGTEAAPPLRRSLAEIALDTDARLLPGRRLAVAALGALPDPEATEDLLQLYAQAGVPEALRARVAEVLAQRRAGREFLVDALLADYDFLDDRSPPPLAAIVPGLVALHETRALPRLVERLFDPDTRLSELPIVVTAIATLGGPSALPALAEFLAMYHADSSLAAAPDALSAAARALWASSVPAHRALVASVARDPATLDDARAELTALLNPETTNSAPLAQAEPETPKPEAALPITLSDEAIARTFVEHADDLRGCVLSELASNPALRAVRLAFVINGNGSLSGLQVLPDHAELVACLKPKLLAAHFPAFGRARRLANYTIAVHPDARSFERPNDNAAGENFWHFAQLRAAGVGRTGKPWWRNRNPLFVSVESEPAPSPSASQAKQPTGESTGTAPAGRAAAPADAWWLPARGGRASPPAPAAPPPTAASSAEPPAAAASTPPPTAASPAARPSETQTPSDAPARPAAADAGQSAPPDAWWAPAPSNPGPK
jgi:outer membrane protein assembly factor BamB